MVEIDNMKLEVLDEQKIQITAKFFKKVSRILIRKAANFSNFHDELAKHKRIKNKKKESK
jgi:hypothetical protein